MIYNFNLGIGWASSGVEYAQAYRAGVLRRIGQEAKFIFTDMFPQDNIEHMTANIGFLDSEIIWLYTFFTDCKIAPVTFTLDRLEATFADREFSFSREGIRVKYDFSGTNTYYMAYMIDDQSDRVHRVEMVSNGYLVRKDYFTYCRIYSEYYAPLDNQAHLYQRRFYNEDGSVAYDEITDNDSVMYQFPDRFFCSKKELVGYLISCLHLTKRDTLIFDRTMNFAQVVMQNAGSARIGIAVHADHFSVNNTDDENILWNNFYEYAFSQHKHVSFYLVSTDAQNRLLKEQFQKYANALPDIVTIPVGSLDELKYPKKERVRHSLITASRLAGEKHIDWLIEAVVEARKIIGDLTLDIYGKGGEEARLQALIAERKCDEFIHLKGQQKMDEVYKDYEAYVSASLSEGFGLTLMEAVGSGLPIIGFDVPYGNQTFIDHGKNGYKIPVSDMMDKKERVQKLAESIIHLFTKANLKKFCQYSYQKARTYLTVEVEKGWINLLNRTI